MGFACVHRMTDNRKGSHQQDIGQMFQDREHSPTVALVPITDRTLDPCLPIQREQEERPVIVMSHHINRRMKPAANDKPEKQARPTPAMFESPKVCESHHGNENQRRVEEVITDHPCRISTPNLLEFSFCWQPRHLSGNEITSG